MKKILFAVALLLSLNSYADTLATLPNNGGGLMYFSDIQCSGKTSSWKVVYTVISGGKTFYGCWFYLDEMVHVEWSGGGSSTFDAKNLTLTKGK
jgi:hypothetical protein